MATAICLYMYSCSQIANKHLIMTAILQYFDRPHNNNSSQVVMFKELRDPAAAETAVLHG